MEFHKIFEELKEKVQKGCEVLSNSLISYWRDETDSYNNKLYVMLFENFKNIQVICNDIDIEAFSQAGATLRCAIEQIAILRVVMSNRALLEEYIKFETLKYEDNTGNDKSKAKMDELYKNRKTKKDVNKNDFRDYGWLEIINQKPSINELLKVAKLEDLIEWRQYCNKFVHSDFTFLIFKREQIDRRIKDFIYIAAVIYEYMIFLLNDLTHMNFYIKGVDYSNEYRLLLMQAELYITDNNALIDKGKEQNNF